MTNASDETDPRSTVLILSGGLDSTTLLYQLRDEGQAVRALLVDYGQRHRKELAFASATCDRLGVECRTADLSSIAPLLAGSSLVGWAGAVPTGEYAEENMRSTVVRNRNMIMLSVAAGWAMDVRAGCVAFAAHHGYHTLYPDCTPEFIDATATAIRRADWRQVHLVAPFAQMTKSQIVNRGAELGVPFDQTWSCYAGGDVHCGRCGTCVERRQAFAMAGVVDPTRYDQC